MKLPRLNNLSQFQLARLKLTGLYLLIIMSVSLLFSVATYHQQADDLNRRFGRFQSIIRQYQTFYPGQRLPLPVNIPDIDETLLQLKLNLLYLNLIILALSATAGYFLAGRTLLPIQKSLDDQARFVADASHEMRTPLTALKTSTEVALRDKNLTHQETRTLLSSNLQKIQDLQGLAESLLKLTHLDHLEKNLKQPVSLSAIIQTALSQVQDQAKAKKIAISSHVPNLTLSADPKSLTEIFIILLDNAIKYNPPGTNVKISAHPTDHAIIVTVEDNGSGIAPEDLPHIFDRFYRADKARSRDVPGYGLGLAIAKQIVTSHGGTIEVRSSRDSGTKFTIHLTTA